MDLRTLFVLIGHCAVLVVGIIIWLKRQRYPDTREDYIRAIWEIDGPLPNKNEFSFQRRGLVIEHDPNERRCVR